MKRLVNGILLIEMCYVNFPATPSIKSETFYDYLNYKFSLFLSVIIHDLLSTARADENVTRAKKFYDL